MAGYGAGNTAHRVSTANGDRLVATRDHYWLALGADCGFGTTSCGFVGVNDGWTDIIANRRLPVWNYDAAKDGYVAVTAEINRAGQNQFVLALAFCVDEPTPITQSTPNKALTAVSEALAYPFDTHADPYSHKQAFNQGWNDAVRDPFEPKANITGDGNALFNMLAFLLACRSSCACRASRATYAMRALNSRSPPSADSWCRRFRRTAPTTARWQAC